MQDDNDNNNKEVAEEEEDDDFVPLSLQHNASAASINGPLDGWDRFLTLPCHHITPNVSMLLSLVWGCYYICEPLLLPSSSSLSLQQMATAGHN